MYRTSQRMVLLAGASAIGLFGMASSASANIVGPPASDFTVVESCVISSGCSGNFTVTNNSGSDGSWYVWGFTVVNSSADSAGTTQTDWKACLSPSDSCTGHGGFFYYNNSGPSDSFANLDNDIAPGDSSDLFTFTSDVPLSPYTLQLVNAGGDTTQVTGTALDVVVPEPASLAILGTGLAALFGASRRRRSRASV